VSREVAAASKRRPIFTRRISVNENSYHYERRGEEKKRGEEERRRREGKKRRSIPCNRGMQAQRDAAGKCRGDR